MKLLLLVLGMVMIVEGLPYAAAPEKMREWLLRISEVPPATLRILGFSSLFGGFCICWIVLRGGVFM